jgi:hypothetical protein
VQKLSNAMAAGAVGVILFNEPFRPYRVSEDAP